MYDVKSERAEEFISDAEIRETMAYAEVHKDDRPLIVSILEKARLCKGLTHREAAVLLASGQQDLTEEMFALARDIKQRFYDNRIVMFAPLYLSNYCVNGCVYCPYHAKNKMIRPPEIDAGRNPQGSHCLAGHGTQAVGFGDRRGPA